MSTVNVNVNAQGLNQVLAALVALQGQMRSVGTAAREMQRQMGGAGGNPPGGGGGRGGGGGNPPPPSPGPAGGAQRAEREMQALRDGARRDSSAIVSAYAEIASSVFALAAAFTMLNKAAQYGDMLKAQVKFAEATGTNMQSVAKSLQMTTKYAINFQEAAQFSSIGRLAGFTTKQVKELAQIGTSAATILGRDVPDALSRMFRGVAKGEPEILDELGIFIRLDNAYKEYVKTVAKGQRVIDLTAAQRRQATFFATRAAGKAMAEGNPEAQINDFTKAGANLDNALKNTLLKITDALGPIVLWFSNNLAAMAGLALLLGGSILSNLSNILLNQTRANAAVTAAKNNLESKRNARAEAYGSGKAQTAALTSLSNFNKLQEAQARTQAAADTKRAAFIREIGFAQKDQIREQLRSGAITAAQAHTALAATEKRMDRLRANPELANRAASLAARSATLAPSAGYAAASLTTANTAAANALAAANGRVALSFASAGAAAKAFGTAALLTLQGVGAYVSVLAARVSALFTLLMRGATAILGPIGIALALASVWKMGTNAIGATSKSMSDFEDSLETVNSRLATTFANFEKIGQVDVGDFTKAILSAEQYSNTLDTMATEIDNIQKALASGAIKPGWAEKGDVSAAASQFSKLNKVLNDQQKASILSTAYTTMFKSAEDRAAKQVYAISSYADKERATLTAKFKTEADLYTQSLEKLEQGVREGKIPFEQYNAIIQEVSPLLGKAAEKAKLYTDTLKGTTAAVDLFKNSYNELAGTLRSESSFNAPLSNYEKVINEMKQSKKAADAMINSPGVSRDVLLNYLNTQVAATNVVREITNQEPLKPLMLTDSISDLKLVKEGLDKSFNSTFNLVKQQEAYTKNLRVSGITAANNAAAAERNLNNMVTKYRNMGLDLSGIAGLMSKITKLGFEKDVASKTANWLKMYDSLASSTNTGTAIEDFLRNKSEKDKEIFSILQEARLSIMDLAKEVFGVPIQINMDSILQSLEPFSKLAAKVLTKELADKLIKTLAVGEYVKQIAAKDPAYYDADFSSKDVNKQEDELFARTATTKRINILAELKKQQLAVNGDLSSYNDLLKKHNAIVEKANKLTQEKWDREQAIFNGYDYGIDKLKLVSEAYSDLSKEVNKSSREMELYLKTLDMGAVSRILEIEGKLRDGAISRADKSAEASIVELKKETVPQKLLDSDAAAAAYRAAYVNLQQISEEYITNEVGGKEVIAQASNEVALAEYNLIEARRKAALEQIKGIQITSEEIKKQNELQSKLNKAKAKGDALTNITEGVFGSLLGGSTTPLSSSLDTMTTELRGMAGKLAVQQGKDGIRDGKDKLLAYFKKEDASGNSTAKQFVKLRDGLKDSIKGVIGEKAFSGFEAAVPGLIQAATGRNDTERKQGLGNAVGSGIGMALGGPVGAAIGSVIGSVAGNYFSKKLKDTGIVATVSALGNVTANTLDIFKKGSFSGTKTIEQVGNSLEAEAISAMQNAVTSTRRSYEDNILRLNSLTNNVYSLTLGGLDRAFSSKYLQPAGGEKGQEELLKDFIKDYGNFLGEGQLGFLSQFQDITESLTDVLSRLVNTMVVAENTFKSAFGTGLGMIGDVSKTYVSNFLAVEGKTLIDQVAAVSQPGASGTYKNLGTVIGGAISATLGGVLLGGFFGGQEDKGPTEADRAQYNQTNKYVRNAIEELRHKAGADSWSEYGNVAKPNDKAAYGDQYPLASAMEDRNYAGVLNAVKALGTSSAARVDTMLMLEKYLGNMDGTHNITSEELYNITNIIKARAEAEFVSNMTKAFDGKDMEERTKAYNEAMAAYSSVVTSSIHIATNQIFSIVQGLNDINYDKLPDGLVAVRSGLLVPIQEFNASLRDAIASGASPEKIAEGVKLGTKMAEVIQGILNVFSSISLTDISGAENFATTVKEGIVGTFKTSAIDSFKKSLLAPLLIDMSTAISDASSGGSGTFKSSMTNYAFSGDTVVNQAKNMVQVLNDPAFTAAMASVSVEFEKLMNVFDTAASSETITKLDTAITDLIKSLKEEAYSFAVDGNEYSVGLFKAREAFVAAGLSAELANKPIAETFAQVKLLASQGKITANNIEAVNEALDAMGDSAIAARDEIVSIRDASGETINTANNFIKSLTSNIIDDSQGLTAAKAALEGLMSISNDKLTAAKTAYSKAKSLDNALDYSVKQQIFVDALEENVNSQIEANNTLMNLAKDKYEAEKAHLENLTTIMDDLAAFIKDIKFDETISILKPIDRLNESELAFNKLKAKVLAEANAGTFDAEAIATLREDAKSLLTLGRDVYASGDEYTSLYNEVNGLMNSLKAKVGVEALTYEASTKLYQDMALSYAQQTRDLQLETVLQLKGIAQSSVVDNAISVDLINALKFNQGLPQGLSLSDYYANLFTSAQSGGTVFTTPNTGYPQFEGIGNYNTANTVEKDTNSAKLTQVLESLTAVLANLPIDVKSAISSTNNLVTKRT